jgi:hypothetical protein
VWGKTRFEQLLKQPLAEDPLCTGRYTKEEAFLIHIVCMARLNIVLAQLTTQQLKVEAVFQLRVSLVAQAIHSRRPA